MERNRGCHLTTSTSAPSARGELMALYTDGVYLVSDRSIAELHQFAERVGLRRNRYHGERKGHPHYDLPRGWFPSILQAGVSPADRRDLVRALRRLNNRLGFHIQLS